MTTFSVIIGLLAAGVAAVAVVWLLVAAKDTILSCFAGESVALTSRAFGSDGRRLGRSVELQAVIGHLAVITRLNLPIHSSLRASAKGESGRVAKALSYMGYLVETGWPVSESLSLAFKGCPRAMVNVLRQGEQCGQFPQAVADARRMLDARVNMLRDAARSGSAAGAYAVIMLMFCAFMLVYVTVIITPRMYNIFSDFGVEMPAITERLIDVARLATQYNGAIALVFSILAALALFMVFHARRGEEGGSVTRAVSAVRSWIPFTRAMDFGFGMSSAIRALAMGLRGGTPLDRSVALVSVVSHTNYLRGRLDDFARQVQGGVLPHKAAAGAGLGDVFVSALKMIERGEDAQTALIHAADYYEATARRWWQSISALYVPLVTLSMACLVCFMALALFMPLIDLMNAISESII